jgi:hypothetical protein
VAQINSSGACDATALELKAMQRLCQIAGHNDGKEEDDDDDDDSKNKNQKLLELYVLIKRVVMKQTGDEYPPCNVIENLLSVLLMEQQQNMSKAQWYEQFCTRVDVVELAGVQFDSFKCLWDYCIKQKGWGEYDTLTLEEQAMIQSKLKE